MSKLVSIILPTHNGAKYLRKSVESCLQQTYRDIELIIVDDASTDNTAEVALSFKDERVHLIRHKENKGLPGALNTGFKASTGEYLTWTSDDNYYLPEAIEKLARRLESIPECNFVYSNYYLFKDNEPDKAELANPAPVFDPANNTGIGASFLYTRKVLEKTGEYDAEAFLAEDYDYWMRVSKDFKLYYLDEPLYYYRFHSNTLTGLRSYEIKVVESLSKLKNGILGIPEVTALLISKCVNRKYYEKPFSGFYVINRSWVRLYRLYLHIVLGEKLSGVFNEFIAGRIRLKEAKDKIYALLLPYITLKGNSK